MALFNTNRADQVDNPMIYNFERFKPTKRYIDNKKIADYQKAIDLLDDVSTVIAFPHAEVFRHEIPTVQEGMIEAVRRLEAGINE